MQRQAAEIRVGMTASLTGRYHVPGRQARVGVQAWIDDTNRAGGIRVADQAAQLPLRFLCYDDAGQNERCSGLVERLIVEDQVDILLGPYASGLTRRAVSVAERYARVLWNHGGSTDAIYRAEPTWVVSILTPASRYFQGVIDAVMHAHPSLRRVVIVHGTSGAFPRDVAAGAAAHCRDRGVDGVTTHAFEPDTENFRPILESVRAEPPDLLLGVGRIEDDLQFAAQLRELDLLPRQGRAVGLIVTPMQLFHTTLGAAANGFLGPSQWEPSVVTTPDYGPSTADVMRRFRTHAPDDIDYPMAQAYAGCLVAQRCIEAAGTLDQVRLRQMAGQLDLTTFYGRYRIDPQSGRQIGHVMPVVQWQQGQKVIVWPPEMRRIERL